MPKNKKGTTCYWCDTDLTNVEGADDQYTSDHLPPSCLFPAEPAGQPDHIPKYPCCRKCNNETFSPIDEEIKRVFCLTPMLFKGYDTTQLNNSAKDSWNHVAKKRDEMLKNVERIGVINDKTGEMKTVSLVVMPGMQASIANMGKRFCKVMYREMFGVKLPDSFKINTIGFQRGFSDLSLWYERSFRPYLKLYPGNRFGRQFNTWSQVCAFFDPMQLTGYVVFEHYGHAIVSAVNLGLPFNI